MISIRIFLDCIQILPYASGSKHIYVVKNASGHLLIAGVFQHSTAGRVFMLELVTKRFRPIQTVESHRLF